MRVFQHMQMCVQQSFNRIISVADIVSHPCVLSAGDLFASSKESYSGSFLWWRLATYLNVEPFTKIPFH